MSAADTANPRNDWGQSADTPKAVKKVVRLPLDTSRDCQRALARLIRRTLAGEIETTDLSRYANALMVLARLAAVRFNRTDGGAFAARRCRR